MSAVLAWLARALYRHYEEHEMWYALVAAEAAAIRDEREWGRTCALLETIPTASPSGGAIGGRWR